MAAKDIQAEIIMEAIRHRLQTIRAADGFWESPSRVVRTNRFNDGWFKDSAYRLIYLIVPYPAHETEQPAKHVTFEHEFSILGLRRFDGSEDPFSPGQTIVEAVTIADGALVIASQPLDPSQLALRIADENGSITGGTITATGTDPLGAALVATVDLATTPRSTSTGWEWTLLGAFKTVSSIVVAGLTGAGAGDTIRVMAGASRWQIQNRMWKDVAERVGTAPQLKNEPGVSNVINVQVVDVDFDLELPRWSVVKIDLRVEYGARVGLL